MMKFDTLAVHSGYRPLDDKFNSVNLPIYQTSNYQYEFLGQRLDSIYSRVSNPTVEAAARAIADLESARFGICFASGIAATDTVLRAILRPGDEVVATEHLYGGNFKLLKHIHPIFGVRSRLVDMQNLDKVRASITSSTKMIFIESPTNPLLRIHDIEALVEFARENNLTTVLDNTFATPLVQKPIELGVDVVVHSATKYLGGHSDLLAGAVVCNERKIYESVNMMRIASGAIMSPFTAFLLLRGIRTLGLRMKRQCKSAFKIAKKLEGHPALKRVIHPFLKSNPDRELAKKQMRYGGAVITLELHSEEDVKKFVKNLKYFILCESLAGVESQINHSFTMSQGSMTLEMKRHLDISNSLVRVSVGIENRDDLLTDLIQALDSLCLSSTKQDF